MKNKSKSNKIVKNKTVKKFAVTNSVYIIDFANVIYILQKQYILPDKVYAAFYRFVYDKLNQGSHIYIVSKLVIINNISYDIQKVFREGERLTNKGLNFLNNIYIFNLVYPIKTSSSIDDVLSWLLCIVIFSKISNPSRIKMITNDKQGFEKNLFGLTSEERNNNIRIARDLTVTTLDFNNNYNYIKVKESTQIAAFIDSFVTSVSENTAHLECNISLLVETLMKKKRLTGTTRHNRNFIRHQFVKSKIPHLDYDSLNAEQKKHLSESSTNPAVRRCKPFLYLREPHSTNLDKKYYAYAVIKYIQMYLNKNNDFYGSWDKEKIIKLFS